MAELEHEALELQPEEKAARAERRLIFGGTTAADEPRGGKSCSINKGMTVSTDKF